MITLQVNGRIITFTEEDLTTILEEYYTTKLSKPVEGEWFLVIPNAINRELFEEERFDEQQEWVRMTILDAFAEVDSNPKYARIFETMWPKKTWNVAMDGNELTRIAKLIGDDMTDWVEQALEWAQRISNGESWESLCNTAEEAECYRMITGQDNNKCLVGASYYSTLKFPTTHCRLCDPRNRLMYTVPSVVRRKK